MVYFTEIVILADRSPVFGTTWREIVAHEATEAAKGGSAGPGGSESAAHVAIHTFEGWGARKLPLGLRGAAGAIAESADTTADSSTAEAAHHAAEVALHGGHLRLVEAERFLAHRAYAVPVVVAEG
jgi:hypothetical protein